MIRLVIILCAIAGAWRLYELSTPEFWWDAARFVGSLLIASLTMGVGLFFMALYYRWKDYRRWKRLHEEN